MSKKSVDKMSLEELRQEEAELADARTVLRERQREVEERIQMETALEGLTPTIRAKLESSVTSAGRTN